MEASPDDLRDGDESSEWGGFSDGCSESGSDSDVGSDYGDSGNEVTAFSNPPPNHKLFTHAYSSLEELEADLYDYCAQARFSVAKLRSVNKVKDFGYSRVYYGCAKGKIRASKATSRITSTSKVGCTWEASAKALLVDGARPWRFSMKPGFEHHHNHQPEDWQASNKFTEEHVDFIKQYLDRPAVRNRELATDMRKQFPNVIFTQRQLRNRRYRLWKKALGGYNPFPATIKKLEEENVPHDIQWAENPTEDDDNVPLKPVGLFWTTPWSLTEWAKYHWVQMYDNTYRTNNKGLAFFQVVALNHLGKAFSCAFGLINNERQEGFNWLMSKVDEMRQKAEAPPPIVTITDYDVAMKKAIAEVYPAAKPQICIFHINKNVALNIKRKWNKEAAAQVAAAMGVKLPLSRTQEENNLDRTYEESVVDRDNRSPDSRIGAVPETVEYSMAGMYKLWEGVVYSHTVNDFNAAWEKLKAYFHQQNDIIRYIEDTWMPVVEQWAGCYLNQRLNFGQRTTSPVESVNRYLKSFIITGRSSVRECVSRSLEMVKAMEANINEAITAEKNRLRYQYIGTTWLGTAPYRISQRALELVTGQHRKMEGALPTRRNQNPTPLEPCSGAFRTQFSVPCSHELLERHRANKPLVQEDFHPF